MKPEQIIRAEQLLKRRNVLERELRMLNHDYADPRHQFRPEYAPYTLSFKTLPHSQSYTAQCSLEVTREEVEPVRQALATVVTTIVAGINRELDVLGVQS